MIDYKALYEQCRRESKSTLDIDDLCAGHPVAEAELRELKAWKQAVDDELVTMQSTAESYASPKEAVKAVIDWNVEVAEFFAGQSQQGQGEVGDE